MANGEEPALSGAKGKMAKEKKKARRMLMADS